MRFEYADAGIPVSTTVEEVTYYPASEPAIATGGCERDGNATKNRLRQLRHRSL